MSKSLKEAATEWHKRLLALENLIQETQDIHDNVVEGKIVKKALPKGNR